MPLTDCPNANCGTATVSNKRIGFVYRHYRAVYYPVLAILVILVLASLFILAFGKSIGLSSPAQFLAAIASIVVLVGGFIFYGFLVQKIGFQANRYTCSRCRYQWMQLDYQPAVVEKFARTYEQLLLARRKQGDPYSLGSALLSLAVCLLHQNNLERAALLLEESVVLFREIGDKRGLASSLNTAGLVALFQGDSERARALLEESVVLARESGDWQVLASPINSLGFVLLDSGEDERARLLFVEALALQYKLSQRDSIAWNLEGLAQVAAARQQMARAATLCAVAQAVREEVGIPCMPAMRQRFERTMALARTTLGETAFAAAWGEGLIMPRYQAVQYALQS